MITGGIKITVRKGYGNGIEFDEEKILQQLQEAQKKKGNVGPIFEEGMAIFKEAVELHDKGDNVQSLIKFEEVADIFHDIPVPELEINCWVFISDIAYSVIFDRDLAIKSYFKLIKLSSDPSILFNAHNNLSTLYLTSNECDEVLKHSSYALECIEKIDDKNHKKIYSAITIYNIGEAHLRLGNYDDAKKNMKEALKLFKKTKLLEGEGKCLSGLGMIYLHEKDSKKSMKNLKKALKIFEKINDKEEIAETLKCLSQAYISLGKKDDAINSLEKAAYIHREIGQNDFANQALNSIEFIKRNFKK